METFFSVFSVGAMNQLGVALESAGFTPEEVTKLRQFKDLGKFRDILSGKALITYLEHLIDCDAAPFIPDGCSVEEHKKGGFFKFTPEKLPHEKFPLYLSRKQRRGSIIGNDLRKELNGKPVMNANVLDYLLANPELIPEEWKGKIICFWGTLYRNADNFLFVRFLNWDDSGVRWSRYWLVNGIGDGDYAALTS